MAESFVQVAPDSTGKKLRTFQALVQQPDGTFSTIQIQAAEIVDEFGNPFELTKDVTWQVQLLDEMRAVRFGIQGILDYLNPASGTPTIPAGIASGVRVPNLGQLNPTEADLIELARQARDEEDI